MTIEKNRIALITGGSSGLGFEMAKQMASEGSTVIICGRSQEKLHQSQTLFPKLVTFKCDITRDDDRQKLYNFITENHPGLNMLINNAGIAHRFLFTRETNLEQYITEEWQTNYIAPILLSKIFLPLLEKNKGTIVNVSSGLAYTPLYIQSNYCATKAALHSMTQSMRYQLASSQIKVIEIFYPAVDTPFQKGYTPPNAMQPDIAAALALKGINKNKDEIRIEKARLMYLMTRIMPKKIFKIINGVIPENAEKLLYGS